MTSWTGTTFRINCTSSYPEPWQTPRTINDRNRLIGSGGSLGGGLRGALEAAAGEPAKGRSTHPRCEPCAPAKACRSRHTSANSGAGTRQGVDNGVYALLQATALQYLGTHVRRWALALLLATAAVTVAAEPLRAVVRSCYDGDTCRVDLVASPPLPPLFGENLPVRLADVDTAELRGTDAACKALARRARDRLRELVVSHDVTLADCHRGKYFRLVCSVVLADGRAVGDVLVAEHLAVRYGDDPCTLAPEAQAP